MTKESRRPNDKKLLCMVSDASALVVRHLVVIRHRVVGGSLFLLLSFAPALRAADVSVLGSKPTWNVLENYQETITHDEFSRLIYNVYCTHGFAPDLIEINGKTAR